MLWLLVAYTLNKSKTKFMFIGSRKRLQTFNTPLSLFIDNAPIQQVVSTKSLGICDENLAWNVHIDNIAKEIASGIGILKRSRPSVTFEVLSTIYSALVQPYFDYWSVVWGICNKSLATKLQKLQNRAARILTFSPYDASVDNLFTSLAWKKLEASMVYIKSLHGLAPQYLNSLFPIVMKSLVSEGKLAIPLPRTNYVKNN